MRKIVYGVLIGIGISSLISCNEKRDCECLYFEEGVRVKEVQHPNEKVEDCADMPQNEDTHLDADGIYRTVWCVDAL